MFKKQKSEHERGERESQKFQKVQKLAKPRTHEEKRKNRWDKKTGNTNFQKNKNFIFY